MYNKETYVEIAFHLIENLLKGLLLRYEAFSISKVTVNLV